MIRHTARALCAATLVIAPLALAATPAHADTLCRVNGVARPEGSVTGTAGSDYIECSSVDAGESVDGLGGNDYITLTGPVNGTVVGGAGRDYITAQPSATVGVNGILAGLGDADYIRVHGVLSGSVLGQAGNDYLQVADNQGAVDGGDGTDVCRIGTGDGDVFNCEY